tara:strand:+ start:33999 stop:34856 length:858 start_codon:yes stop_codon:yes gene_type:complete
MRGKICLITGGTSGIGKAAATELARQGATVVLAARSQGRGAQAARDISIASGSKAVEVLVCDLASQASIRLFASDFLAKYERLDVLLHSGAAVFSKRTQTEDAVESNFAVAYLSIFLIASLLRERLVASAPARVVIVTGEYHRKTSLDFDNLMGEKRFSMIEAGSRAALAKTVFSAELARQLEARGVTVNCLHPGAVRTALLRNLPWYMRAAAYPVQYFFSSPEVGAKTPVYLASSPAVEGVTGKYFIDCKPVAPSAEVMDKSVGAKLWQASEALVQGSEPAIRS